MRKPKIIVSRLFPHTRKITTLCKTMVSPICKTMGKMTEFHRNSEMKRVRSTVIVELTLILFLAWKKYAKFVC